MNTKYAALFQPYKIGNVQIQNRFAMAPMSLVFINTINGEYTEHGMEYMINRARGGFGLLFTGAFSCDYEVDPVNPLSGNPLNNPGAFIKQGKELTSRCNAFGTKVFGQITVGLGRNYPTYYGPSEEPVFGMPDVKSPELPVSGIKRKLELLADVAKIMQDAGFAGVEVHALHWGYLLDEFAMSMFNHRKDEYGGSLENRLRFAKEAVEAIKAKCGAAFPVTVRLGMKGYVKADYTASVDGSDEAGRTLEEAVEMAKLLERFGYDALSVDTGIYESFYYACPPCYVPRGYALEMAKRIKEAVNIPVLCGGRMGSADIALKAVEDGFAEGVVLGRPSIADPEFPRKVETGRVEKIRPCIACSQGCMHRLFNGQDAFCAVNPDIRMGSRLPEKAAVSKKVLVVGGGVTGMEAARTAALRGHSVVLCEKTDKLGGNLLTAGAHSFKREVLELNEWYKRELADLGVQIFLNREMDAEAIKAEAPDAVVLSVGSAPAVPPIPGIENAVPVLDVLTGKKVLGKKVVIVGGGLVGAELALDCLQQGKQVTIVEALDDILSAGEPIPMAHDRMLRDWFAYYHANILTGTRLAKVTTEGAVATDKNGEEIEIPADDAVIAIGFRPLPSMRSELLGAGFPVYEVGDGKQVANILRAVWDAAEVARSL